MKQMLNIRLRLNHFLLISSFLLSASLAAVPIVQEFYLPYPENQVFNAFSAIFPGNSACGFPTSTPNVSAPIRTYISISPYLNSTIIYYDQWEDGYETEITNPTQATTQVWGDNNPANGIPPGFTTDIINAGQAIVLQNNINPNNLALLDYDARDRLGVSKPVSITKSHWATGPETLMAGTLLVYPTSDWGTYFVMPTGQNVYTSVQSFSYTGFSVMAAQDGTVVNIDADANGTFETTITLNEGQSYHVNGGVLKGAKIQSTKPIQVHLTTGDICDNYESRWFNVQPLASWGNNYIGPLSGTDKLYLLYNPGTTSLTIRVSSSSGNLSDINIAPNSVASLAGIANAGYRFISQDGSPFAVLAMSDASANQSGGSGQNKSFDWGASLLPISELTQQAVAGWAPGQDPNFPITENSSPVWISVSSLNGNAVGKTTKVCVDYDGDNAGTFTDTYGRRYDAELTLTALQSFKVYDPDGDQTNMLLYVCDGSDAIISTVWGEDAATATPASPGLDLGNGIPGINPFYAYKTGNLATDLNGNGLYNILDVVRFSIGITNNGLVPVTGSYNVKDLLPQWVTYISNSTQITRPGNVVSAISDAGSTNFPLDEGGTNISLTLNPGQEAVITFRAIIIAKPPGDGCMTNIAEVSKGGITYQPTWSFCVTTPVENCTGFFDEDGDGLNNCDDPDCFVSAATGGQFCTGTTITLGASGGTTYSWTGPGGFTSSTANPTRANATLAMSGNYSVVISNGTCTSTKTVAVNVAICNPTPVSCDAASCLGNNLATVGTFESFPNGMNSDLTYVNCGTTYTGTYSVVQAAGTCATQWVNLPDHTLSNGNGQYLVADFATTSPGPNTNGNSVSSEIICIPSISVAANTTYCLSAWFAKLCSACPGNPDIRFVVNGITIGTAAGSGFTAGGWTKRGFSFSTTDLGNPSTVTICIAQNAFGADGFDLAIDDIELRAVLTGANPTVANDVVTLCNSSALTINVLANDSGYTASTLTVSAQPPSEAGTVSVSGTNLVFNPVVGYTGQVSFSYTVCGAVNGCCASGVVIVNMAPVTAVATTESPVCTGTNIVLVASGGNTYSWTGPNGFTSTLSNAPLNNVSLSATGTYNVTVSNSSGCSATASVPLVVNSCTVNRDPQCNCN